MTPFFYDPSEEYQPTSEDIAWAHDLIHIINEGGIWVFPATGMIFQFNHAAHEVRLVNRALRFRNKVNARMFERTVAVFGAIGYDVK